MKTRSLLIVIIIIVMITVVFLSACDNQRKEPPYVEPVIPPPIEEEPISNFFTYNYNEATSANQEEKIELLPNEFNNKKLVVPEREGYEFDGWYADWYLSKRVSDNQGQIIIGKELFDDKNRNLYAKWKKEDAPVYPILMVFVTEIDAVLQKMDETDVVVKYSMTDIERRVFDNITVMFKQHLDAMLNGDVVFKVDPYFTTIPLGAKSLTKAKSPPLSGIGFYREYGLYGYNIPELGGMEWPEYNGLPPITEIEGEGILSKYRSVLTTFCMNDFYNDLHITAGSSAEKYASIHMEPFFQGFYEQGESLDILFTNERGIKGFWEFYMRVYLHEFTHSVEFYPENKEQNSIDFHGVIRKCYYKYGNGQSGNYKLEIIRLYLRNKIEIDGMTLGIPKKFWEQNK